ncbi:hypothetical protein DY000_02061955 [Brassica cretica]|uniref:Uncharacterized protein n=1 Tax=Brassica cretica TaxID=69181 RepID=A0ABQ7B4K6_BRACR|nr:hypothetical protein DY000_02061955 [Brassica cretica]
MNYFPAEITSKSSECHDISGTTNTDGGSDNRGQMLFLSSNHFSSLHTLRISKAETDAATLVPTSTDESSLDRRVLIRSTSPHSTVLSSLRSTIPHLTDESSPDGRVLTRPTSPHSTDESSLDRQVLTRPMSPHSIDESSLDRSVVTSIDESSLDRRVVT